MNSFLILFSLVLNGVLILAIINLYLRQNRLVEVEQKLTKSLKEMESIISSYLFEMKDENELFIKKLQQIDLKQGKKKQNTSIEVKEQQYSVERLLDDELQTDVEPIVEKGHSTRRRAIDTYKSVNYKSDKKIATEAVNDKPSFDETLKNAQRNVDEPANIEDLITYAHLKDSYEKDVPVYDQIIQLQKDGLTLDEIAKKMSKGKTEIELILKLQH